MKSPTVSPPTPKANQFIESVDHVASELELKWGAGRLRLLVNETMRAKFDRQLAKFNDAVWSYDDRKIEKHSQAMRRAWQALDKEAEATGAEPLDPEIFETALQDGTVIAICRNNAEAYVAARRFKAEGRDVNVWSIDEVGRMIASVPSLVDIKRHFPGATVKNFKTAVHKDFDDVVPF